MRDRIRFIVVAGLSVVVLLASTGIAAAVPTAPGAPTGLSFKIEKDKDSANRQLIASWQPPVDNGSQIISYTATLSPGNATCTTRSTGCAFLGLTNGTLYTMRVRATNSIGTGPFSVPASESPGTQPGAVRSVVATAYDRSIHVSWSPPLDTGGSPITRYVAIANRVEGGGGGGCDSTTLRGTSCVITGLDNNQLYEVSVLAENRFGRSRHPASASGTFLPRPVPGAPQSVGGIPSNRAVEVSWTAASSPTPVLSYTVTASPGGRTCRAPSFSTPLRCTVTGLTNGIVHTFTVTASNIVGTGPPSAPSPAIVPTDLPGPVTVPTEPGRTIIVGNSSITFRWDPAIDHGVPISRYTITSSPDNRSCTWTEGPLTCTVSGLTNDKDYRFTFQAFNKAGAGPTTTTAPITPLPLPGPPRDLNVISGLRTATVSWSAPISDGGTPITGYTLTLSPGGLGCTWSSGPLTCTVDGLRNGTTYTYSLVAINRAGPGPAATRNVALLAPPAPPRVTDIIEGDRSITVVWDAPRNDGGSPITGYTVTSSPEGRTCRWSDGPLTCTITGLTNGTAYQFTVTATTRQGSSSTTSGVTTTSLSAGFRTNCAARSDGTVQCWGSASSPETVPDLSGVASVSTGAQSSCALLRDGTARCWGLGMIFSLGDGVLDRVTRSTPVIVKGVSGAVALSSANGHSCALSGDGTVKCWGYVELEGAPCFVPERGAHEPEFHPERCSRFSGDTASGEATTVPSLSTATAITSGAQHTCALLSDRTVTCWGGSNTVAHRGDESRPINEPIPVPGLTNVTSIAAGGSRTCAVRGDGSVGCWSHNSLSFSNGLGVMPATRYTAIETVPGLEDAKSVTVSSSHACALRRDDTVVCWGSNGSGQLGDGTTVDRIVPVSVNGLRDVTTIAAGSVHTCARRTDGGIWCWGDASFGQLGDSADTGVRTTPIEAPTMGPLRPRTVPEAPRSVRTSMGDGTVMINWSAPGFDGGAPISGYTVQASAADQGGAGPDTRTCTWAGGPLNCAIVGLNAARRYTFTVTATNAAGNGPASAAVGSALAIAAGDSHTCALLVTGGTRCWGANDRGQLGDGTTTTRLSAVTVGGLTGAIAIAAGANHTCALRADHNVVCWGANERGQLGDGSTTDRSLPVSVSGLSGVIAIAAGAVHTCASLDDGTVRCWGGNGAGQLGDGTTAARTTPTPVSGLNEVTAISSKFRTTCALRTNSRVRCWGSNASGQLGEGTTINRSSPTLVGGLTDAVAVATGNNHACAIRATGTAVCWGANGSGQLGDGTTTNRTTPVTATGLSGLADLTAGTSHTCARRTDGTAVCWGADDVGQLGDGGSVNPTGAVTVGGLMDVAVIRAGGSHTCALTSGFVRCWGGNQSGQVGDGTTTNRPVPTSVII